MLAFAPNRRFEVVRPLGRGGMGEVFEVFDREQATTCALKLLPAVTNDGVRVDQRTDLQASSRPVSQSFLKSSRARPASLGPPIPSSIATASP